MRRRNFLGAVGTGAGALVAGTPDVATAASRIDSLAFDSTCSLLDANADPVTGDPGYVAVTTESTAFNQDSDSGDNDGGYDFIAYPDGTEIPLVASDGGVVGFGAPIVQDGTSFPQNGNEEFVLNVLDEEVPNAGGTVLWDDGHGQFYDSGSHISFFAYAEDNGYDIRGTTTLIDDLGGADAVVITSPAVPFGDDELAALDDFVTAGGTLLLFGQSDFGDFDHPHKLNDIAASVGAPFRFNDDQVNDYVNNAGIFFVPSTDEFSTGFDYFTDRPGISPPDLERDRRYTADVVDVTDGDTVDVLFSNGYVGTIRLLGIDTPETFADIVSEEWEGIDDAAYLRERGFGASDFAFEQLAGETVELYFDAEEPFRGGAGRLLMYLEYDADGDGTLDTLYNRRVIQEGYGRVYDSGLTRHDEFIALERRAKRRGAGVWAESDIDARQPLASRPARVEKVFVPKAVPVAGTDGRGIDVVARASDGATQAGAPLAAVDQRGGVAVVGGQVIDEDYEEDDSPVATPAAYHNYQFAAGLAEQLTNRAGELLIDGGHGQFNAEEAMSAEDAAFFQRYLEGLDWRFTQYNDLSTKKLSRGRTLFVSSPSEPYGPAELEAMRRFKQGGGAIVVFADRTGERGLTNSLLRALDTPLRVGSGVVDDETNNAGEAFLPVTSVSGIQAPVYDEDEGEGGRGRGNGRSIVHGDPLD